MPPETIVALATPAGRGGIGVVRLSGADALAIARGITGLASGLQPQHAYYTHVHDQDGAVLDDALLTWFAAPRSYTGEDVVEISTHGSPIVLQTVVEQSKRAGARAAHAGEFTERAFLNGKLDLTAAEAVRDLIDSSTVVQARLAAEQLGGALQREVRPLKEVLVHLIATLEAGIDFAEDDIETADDEALAEALNTLQPPLQRLLQSFAYGRAVREGLRLAIVGRPNAGKSSLFNRLLERDRAIVTPIAGTTRDVITERAAIGGVPVELMDTAGLRTADDPIEQMGIARSHEAMADADVILHVMDATAEEPSPALPAVAAGEALPVYNKVDLLTAEQRDRLPAGVTLVSAVSGEGMDQLRALILERTGNGHVDVSSGILTNMRQRDSVEQALQAILRARQSTTSGVPHEMLLLDLYEALQALDALTGQTTSDDVLHRIFSSFCIGK